VRCRTALLDWGRPIWHLFLARPTVLWSARITLSSSVARRTGDSRHPHLLMHLFARQRECSPCLRSLSRPVFLNSIPCRRLVVSVHRRLTGCRRRLQRHLDVSNAVFHASCRRWQNTWTSVTGPCRVRRTGRGARQQLTGRRPVCASSSSSSRPCHCSQQPASLAAPRLAPWPPLRVDKAHLVRTLKPSRHMHGGTRDLGRPRRSVAPSTVSAPADILLRRLRCTFCSVLIAVVVLLAARRLEPGGIKQSCCLP